MRIRTSTLLCLSVLFAACGGGGGGGSEPGASTPPPSGNARFVSATAEKGPFVIGSSVTVNRLDSQAQPIASTLTTETEDNLGNFSFSIDPGPVSISVDGFHFNEITGGLAQGRLTLRAIYEVRDTATQRAHVNILTHLIHLRVEALVQAGSSIPDAVQTAQAELVGQLAPIFGPFSPDNFTNYSVYASDSTSGEGAAYMLAVTASIYQFAITRGGIGGFDSELALILNNLSDDFADGIVDLQWIFDGIDAGSVQVDPEQLSANLLAHASSVGFTAEPADASLFIDTDRDGIMNAVDDDDDNDGLADDVDPEPLIPANKLPTISGELPRYLVTGLQYYGFLEATDPDGDTLTVWGIEGGPGSLNASIYPPGQVADIFPPPPQYQAHTIFVGGAEYRPPGVYSTRLTITDGTDFAVYETELEVVAAADAPILTTHPPTIGFRGESYSGTLESTNPRGTDLVWTIESGPEWLGIDPATGELGGTIPLDHRLEADLVPVEYHSLEDQLGYCRRESLLGNPDSCPVDTVIVGIDDGVIKTEWVVHIDLYDTGEEPDPVVDGNQLRETLADAVFTDSQNFIYVAGSIGGSIDGNNELGLDDVFVKKLDNRQVEQWTRKVGTSGADRLLASVMDTNEDIYLYVQSDGDWRPLVGDSSSPTGDKRFVVKLSTSGELQWAVELAAAGSPSIAALPDGGVRVLVDGQLVDVDPLGNTSPLEFSSVGSAWSEIAVSSDGSTILTGEFYLSRLDPSGVELWAVEFDVDRQMTWTGRSIAFDSSGNITVSGDGFRSALDGRGWFLARYSADGSQNWFNGYTIADEQRFHDVGPNGIAVDSSGNIIVAGRLWLEAFTTDPYGGNYDTVSKFDPGGNLLWYHKLWRVDGNPHMSVVENSASELIVIGSGGEEPRLDYPGQYECSEQEPCRRHLRVARNQMAILYSGDGGFDYYMVKLDSSGAEK